MVIYRNVTSLHFSDDSDGQTEGEEEIPNFLHNISVMEISAEMTERVTNRDQPITTEVSVSGPEMNKNDKNNQQNKNYKNNQ